MDWKDWFQAVCYMICLAIILAFLAWVYFWHIPSIEGPFG